MDLGNPLLAYLAAFTAGILSSASPCVLAVIPLIIGYVGGYADGDWKRAALYSGLFSFGLAITFSLLGVIAGLTGTLVGDIGVYWKYLVVAVAILMGLQLLGLFQLPSFGVGQNGRFKPKGLWGALALGLLFGLVISPCATPFLAIVLAYVAAKQNTFYAGSVLFAYSLGYTAVIFICGLSTGIAGAVLRSEKLQAGYELVRKASGVILILAGLYYLFNGH